MSNARSRTKLIEHTNRGTESVEWIKELEDTIMEITEVEWNKGKEKKKKKTEGNQSITTFVAVTFEL